MRKLIFFIALAMIASSCVTVNIYNTPKKIETPQIIDTAKVETYWF